ncbi:MYXO-CTERM sorting domain-containing protein [Nannocystis exedens]|uniref:MYXO-CTERM sorting domain-containing protein n=1 Tax=Nannocystis exedens TaxID=54 RepID=UPI000BBA030D|nr:MYXO-CTERM sorting domain-containing protein [Nannocystis exedens]PCC73806.1 hypothetical protein NAEX_06894 [Nannocystis exedens]
MFKTSRLRRLLEGTTLLSACALSVLVARPAEACAPPEPGLESSVPADGAIYPGNAALLFEGFSISLDGVTVTVDGEPATLVPAPFDDLVSGHAVVVEPTPMAGQTVVVSGPFCDACEPETITYTAGPADVEAPQPIVESSFFAVYDHADFLSSGGDCMSDSDLTLYVHLSQMSPPPGEPTLVTIAWDPDGEGDAGFRRNVRVPTGAQVIPLSLVTEQFGGKDPLTEVCLEVTAFDAAGNAAEPFELCPACFARTDAIEHGVDTPAEPEWSEVDGVPGSPCAGEEPQTTGEETDTGASSSDTAPTTGGGSDTSGDPTGDSSSDTDSGGATGGEDGDKGCACSSNGGDPGDAGRFLLFVLGLGLALVKRRS